MPSTGTSTGRVHVASALGVYADWLLHDSGPTPEHCGCMAGRYAGFPERRYRVCHARGLEIPNLSTKGDSLTMKCRLCGIKLGGDIAFHRTDNGAFLCIPCWDDIKAD